MPEVEQPLNQPIPMNGASGNHAGASVPASILVIDDEAGIRESLEVLLTLEGYSVRTANDGEEGLRILELENFDRILKTLRDRKPYRPFTVALVNGDRFEVDHPDALVVRDGVAGARICSQTPDYAERAVLCGHDRPDVVPERRPEHSGGVL